MKIQPYTDTFISKGIFEINVIAVANTSIHGLNRKSLCPVCGHRE